VAGNSSAPERVAASASPIQSEQIATIPLTLSVQLLTQPNERGNLRLDAPADLIGEEAFFALRYFVNGRARRAVAQALRVTGAGGGRDIVTARIISDTAVQQREARRSTLGIMARVRRVSDDPVEAARDVDVELVDASRTGVGFSSLTPFTHGDRLVIDLDLAGHEPLPAEIEIVRHDTQLATPYGARFVDRDLAGPFFARVLDAVWTEPAGSGPAPAGDATPAVATAEQEQARGLRTRRPSD
jgi:hypothetical protein